MTLESDPQSKAQENDDDIDARMAAAQNGDVIPGKPGIFLRRYDNIHGVVYEEFLPRPTPERLALQAECDRSLRDAKLHDRLLYIVLPIAVGLAAVAAWCVFK